MFVFQILTAKKKRGDFLFTVLCYEMNVYECLRRTKLLQRLPLNSSGFQTRQLLHRSLAFLAFQVPEIQARKHCISSGSEKFGKVDLHNPALTHIRLISVVTTAQSL